MCPWCHNSAFSVDWLVCVNIYFLNCSSNGPSYGTRDSTSPYRFDSTKNKIAMNFLMFNDLIRIMISTVIMVRVFFESAVFYKYTGKRNLAINLTFSCVIMTPLSWWLEKYSTSLLSQISALLICKFYYTLFFSHKNIFYRISKLKFPKIEKYFWNKLREEILKRVYNLAGWTLNL